MPEFITKTLLIVDDSPENLINVSEEAKIELIPEPSIRTSARIMALVDVFNVLISRRVYKHLMTNDEAQDIIAYGRDRHLDPNLLTDVLVVYFSDFCGLDDLYRDPSSQSNTPSMNPLTFCPQPISLAFTDQDMGEGFGFDQHGRVISGRLQNKASTSRPRNGCSTMRDRNASAKPWQGVSWI